MTLPPRLPRSVWAKKSKRSKRIRCEAHLKWVRSHACILHDNWMASCSGPIEAAHVRTGTNGGMGLKPDDCWAISLCRHHHAIQHTLGEEKFERHYGIDMKALAREFAERSPYRAQLRRKEAA